MVLGNSKIEEDAYLAGFFDGEGTIIFQDDAPGFRIGVSCVNTVRAPIARLKKAYGGYIYYYKRSLNGVLLGDGT